MATFNNGESGLSVRNKLNTIINKVEGVTSIDNDIDVTGTVTADGLVVDGGAKILGSASNTLIIADATEANGYQLKANTNASADFGFLIENLAGKDLLKIDTNGDISFYEDQGTTPKFHWSASAESLGIGTSSPSTALDLSGGTKNQVAIFRSTDATATIGFADSSTPLTANLSYVTMGAVGSSMVFNTNLNERMRIDSSGNVGIGDSNPLSILHVGSGSDANVPITLAPASGGNVEFRNTSGTGSFTFTNTNGSSEKMRIDSSGNLLVGQSSTTNPAGANVTGVSLGADGLISSGRDYGDAAIFGRRLSDGSIVSFAKDGSTVGSIGTVDGDLLVHSSASGHKGLRFGNGYVAPTDNSGVIQNATTDLGLSTHNFKDLYLSGGVYLGGTGSANKLDDYEEGTFVVTATPETSGTITLQSGVDTLAYTKIGSLCTIQGLMNVTSVSSPVGDAITIATLPFIAADLAEFAGRSVASVAFRDNSTSSWSNEVAWVGEGGTSFNIYKDASTVASNDQFYITLTYRTT